MDSQYKESHMPCAFEQTQTGLGMADGETRSNSSTATPVISLFKLKNFLHQPKFKSLLPGDDQQQQPRAGQRDTNSQPPNCPPLTHHVPSAGSNIVDENRSGPSALDASPMSHGLYGSHAGRGANTSPPVAHSQAMLVVPQPVKGAGGHANGTGRKYQCKMCPQVSDARHRR